MPALPAIACRSPTRPSARSLEVATTARRLVAVLVFVLAIGLAVGGSQGGPLRDALLPENAKPMCPFGAMELADWFQSGTVETNGIVRPPNSMVVLPGSSHCDFFKWAARSFLWVTSTGEGGGMTFESPEFFTVAAPNDQDQRVLTRGSVDGDEARGNVNTANSTGSKPREKPLEQSGQPMSGGVLMAQNGSLVYFANHVNDVFAYFMTGAKKGEIPRPPPPRDTYRLPVVPSDLQKVVDYAQTKGIRLRNPDTLPVIVKSAWIETTGLDETKYITIKATVPDFDRTTNPARWTRKKDDKTATLALVGMHITAGIRSDATLIWATYEHIANAPVGAFSYFGDNRQVRAVQSIGVNPEGAWQFSAGDCTVATKRPRMRNVDGGAIEAQPGETIGPTNTCRFNAWGAPKGETPILLESTTRIIDVNRNTMGKLPSDDVRSNYILVGAAWNRLDGAQKLANTTLETFTQQTACLDCHVDNLEGGLNRMWPRLRPLD
jgi:hypothetical protein